METQDKLDAALEGLKDFIGLTEGVSMSDRRIKAFEKEYGDKFMEIVEEIQRENEEQANMDEFLRYETDVAHTVYLVTGKGYEPFTTLDSRVAEIWREANGGKTYRAELFRRIA